MTYPSIQDREDNALGRDESNRQQTWAELRRQVADGLHTAHGRASGNTSKILETASFLYALIELLSESGQVSIDALDERKRDVAKRLKLRYEDDRMGVILQHPPLDKYTFDRAAKIDCENRVHLCKASCCRLPFALSKQDLEERVVRWNLAFPYLIEQREDGYCTHLDQCTKGCGIYEKRPVPCRGYDCRNDKRIWLDFEERIPNPAVEHSDWLQEVSEDRNDKESLTTGP